MDLHKEFQLIKQGAEAKLYKGDYLGKVTLIKERFPKRYRHNVLDESLTKERMKAEARSIVRCKIAGIRTPTLYLVDFERKQIYMEFVENSITVKDYIFQMSELTIAADCARLRPGHTLDHLAQIIGKVLGKMHANNIIHGDLTTSNMLLVQDQDEDTEKLVLIDFGLSRVDSSAEDKSVDLYVLERALLSTHSNAEKLFPILLQSYAKENIKESMEVLKKLEDVRARGRKRTMVG